MRIISEEKLALVDFNLIEKILPRGGLRYILSSDMKLRVSSMFYLRLLFSGNYDQGCGLTFNIMDNNRENIYHLDFRFNIKNRYRQIIQTYKFNGKWGKESFESVLPDLVKENDIFVTVTDEHIEVTINNIKITPKFPVNLSRLSSFKDIYINILGSCIQLDMRSSYMSNRGELESDIAIYGTVTEINL